MDGTEPERTPGNVGEPELKEVAAVIGTPSVKGGVVMIPRSELPTAYTQCV